jgi:RimJ/RimL family protein N-acetyltransferase
MIALREFDVILLKELKRKNIDAVVEHFSRIKRVPPEELRTFWEEKMETEIEHAWNSNLNHFRTIVDETTDQIIGSLWYRTHDDPANADLCFLSWIGIDEAYRNRGNAKAAINELKVHAKNLGMRRLALQVFNDNEPAVRLYGATGFAPTRTIMHTYL